MSKRYDDFDFDIRKYSSSREVGKSNRFFTKTTQYGFCQCEIVLHATGKSATVFYFFYNGREYVRIYEIEIAESQINKHMNQFVKYVVAQKI